MHLYKQQKELQPSTYYVQSFTLNSSFYLLDGLTDTRTHTHTPKIKVFLYLIAFSWISIAVLQPHVGQD